mmetsp:Transcript_136907/g.355438  ORF Transcript_136907/g.355438 Transcript_136907/m.355438 type:complete len:791 (+) Transcript_136907:92-2464(+)
MASLAALAVLLSGFAAVSYHTEASEVRSALPECPEEDQDCHRALGGDEPSLLQHRAQGQAGAGLEVATGVRKVQSFLPQPGEPFREPHVVRSGVTLRLGVAKLCGDPMPGSTRPQCFFTRAYGTSEMPPQIPGPTLRIWPGEHVRIRLANDLRDPSPQCMETAVGKGALGDLLYNAIFANGFCQVNETNLHTHGLHVSPQKGHDDVFVSLKPREAHTILIDVPSYHMAGTFWYHAHRHHSTAVQAGGGAIGCIIVEDPPNSLPPVVRAMQEKVMVVSLVDMRYRAIPVPGQPGLEEFSHGNLWKNEAGKYVDQNAVVALVNGLYKPELHLGIGRWYRFRMVYAASELNLAVRPRFYRHAKCEMQLLAKDGVYLNVAPRKVRTLYFGSGSRVDVAVRCVCRGDPPCTANFVSTAYELDYEFPAADGANATTRTTPTAWVEGPQQCNSGPLSGLAEPTLQQVLVQITLDGPPAPNQVLRSFRVNRPCYLVDLRRVPVARRDQGRIEFMNPVDWRVTWSEKMAGTKVAGVSMRNEHMTPPLARMEVGTVHQWYVRGPTAPNNILYDNRYTGLSLHIFHLHVNPFQLVSLSPPVNEFFEVGDWHDTFFHNSGQALVKLQLDSFTGKDVIHCHLLSHEDMGMMAYFDVYGREGAWWQGARQVDPGCYRGAGGAGYRYVHRTRGLARPQWVKGEPGDNCHEACASSGGCSGLWPELASDARAAFAALGEPCGGGVPANATAEHAPSLAPGGVCIFLAAPRGNRSALWEQRRCGVDPPSDVNRLCRCNGLVDAADEY